MTMNFNIKPFDDVRVRRAVNMAINKQRLVQVLNNRGTVTGRAAAGDGRLRSEVSGLSSRSGQAKALLAEAGQAAAS